MLVISKWHGGMAGSAASARPGPQRPPGCRAVYPGMGADLGRTFPPRSPGPAHLAGGRPGIQTLSSLPQRSGWTVMLGSPCREDSGG